MNDNEVIDQSMLTVFSFLFWLPLYQNLHIEVTDVWPIKLMEAHQMLHDDIVAFDVHYDHITLVTFLEVTDKHYDEGYQGLMFRFNIA